MIKKLESNENLSEIIHKKDEWTILSNEKSQEIDKLRIEIAKLKKFNSELEAKIAQNRIIEENLSNKRRKFSNDSEIVSSTNKKRKNFNLLQN